VKREAESATKTCCELWRLFNAREWDKARKLLSNDFEAYWPQSREKIVGRNNFIELNRRYPGDHKIQILDSMCEYDEWDKEFAVSTQVYIESKMPDGKEMKLYAASFFELNLDGQIKSATEYWGDTYEPPDWRKDLVEWY
jgi:hypothetical protein